MYTENIDVESGISSVEYKCDKCGHKVEFVVPFSFMRNNNLPKKNYLTMVRESIAQGLIVDGNIEKFYDYPEETITEDGRPRIICHKCLSEMA